MCVYTLPADCTGNTPSGSGSRCDMKAPGQRQRLGRRPTSYYTQHY